MHTPGGYLNHTPHASNSTQAKRDSRDIIDNFIIIKLFLTGYRQKLPPPPDKSHPDISHPDKSHRDKAHPICDKSHPPPQKKKYIYIYIYKYSNLSRICFHIDCALFYGVWIYKYMYIYRNPGQGHDTLLLRMIPGDLLSAFPLRQFDTLPGFLDI